MGHGQTPRPAETAFELATERSQRAVDAEAPWFPQRNMGFTRISCDFIGYLLDFMGFSWHLLAFMGYYWHLIYLLLIVKNHTLLAIYYILDFTGFDGFYQEKCRAGPPKHGDSTKKKWIVAAVHSD
jgi:hypothetical protein